MQVRRKDMEEERRMFEKDLEQGKTRQWRSRDQRVCRPSSPGSRVGFYAKEAVGIVLIF